MLKDALRSQFELSSVEQLNRALVIFSFLHDAQQRDLLLESGGFECHLNFGILNVVPIAQKIVELISLAAWHDNHAEIGQKIDLEGGLRRLIAFRTQLDWYEADHPAFSEVEWRSVQEHSLTEFDELFDEIYIEFFDWLVR